MYLVIERSVLAKAVSHVQSVAEKRNAIPILSNILFDAESDQLTLTATDMDVSIVEQVPAQVHRPGSITVPAQILHDLLSKLPDGLEVEMKLDEDSNRMQISAGRSKFMLATQPKQDFPLVETNAMPVQFMIAAAELKRLIDKTIRCVAREETRYYLTGIFLHRAETSEGQMLGAVSTDGHRLARALAPLPSGAEALEGLILPAKTSTELSRLLDQTEGDVRFAASDTKVHVTIGKVQIISKVVDGTFPDYRQVIPTQNDKVLHVDRQAFRAALDRVSTIVSDRTHSVKMLVEPGTLTLSANSTDQGTAAEPVEADYNQEVIDSGFNARYLLEIVSQIEGDWLRLSFFDGAKPALVNDTADPNVLFVMMPMRV